MRHPAINDALKMVRRNVYIGNRRTTLALENYFWKTLEGISFVENMTVDEILNVINEARRNQNRLTATVRYISTKLSRYSMKAKTSHLNLANQSRFSLQPLIRPWTR